MYNVRVLSGYRSPTEGLLGIRGWDSQTYDQAGP